MSKISFLLTLLTMTENFTRISSSSSLIERKKIGLYGEFLKFAVYPVPPFYIVTTKPDGNYSVTGSDMLKLEWLERRLNFSVVYVVLNETAIAKYGSSNNLVINLLAKKEIHGSAISFIITPQRKEVMDFASFTWIEPYSMVVPRPGEDDRLLAFIRVFEPTVWLFILITILLVTSFMTLLSKVYATNKFTSQKGPLAISRQPRTRSIYEYANVNFTYIANTLTNKGGNVPGASLSFRFLIGIWVLVATVLVNSYSSTVTSYLTVPRMIPPINSLEDLAASRDVGIVLLEDTIFGQQILQAKTGVMKTLGDQARVNPGRLFSSVVKVSKLLETKRYALPYLQSFSNFYVANHFKAENKCNYVATDPLPMYGVWELPLQKNSEFTPMFKTALIELWETGLPLFWVRTVTPSAPKCFAKVKPQATLIHSIQLDDVLGIFLVWGIGFSLSLIVFSAEVVFAKYQRRSHN